MTKICPKCGLQMAIKSMMIYKDKTEIYYYCSKNCQELIFDVEYNSFVKEEENEFDRENKGILQQI